MTLKEVKIGQTATVLSVGGDGALRQHILDMGVIPGTEITVVKLAPMGDPMELRLHGYELTLRLADANEIEVKPSDNKNGATTATNTHDTFYAYEHSGHEHPRYGEPHRKGESFRHGHELAPGEDNDKPQAVPRELTFALIGNQNCGKTMLFNQLTGMNQHVGNFPGVTIDRKEGTIKGHPDARVVDLPGIYSLSPYTAEEIVSRDFILNEHPTGIINILDATNIERNLYLTMQLIELGLPIVVALNMMDEVKNNGGTILVNILEQRLGVPVVPISALHNQGVAELVDHALHVARYDEGPAIQDFCSPDDHGGAVHRAIHAISHLIEDHAARVGIPRRFAATKLLEGDSLVMERLQLEDNEKSMVYHIRKQMEDERGLDPAAAIADMRYSFILKACSDTVVKPRESKEHARSRAIDRVLTGKWTAIPTFLIIMILIFWLTFDVIGGTLQDLIQEGVDWFTAVSDQALTDWHVNTVIHSLVIDGIYTGVGTVVSFLPLIVILFFFLSMLEDSGYMARIAFFMDKSMRRLGLSGRSIVPLLIGFGCSVPSIMAARTLPSERDRRMTVLLTPFMSCSAKLPIYGFFVTAFFAHYRGLMMTALYLGAIIVGIIVALITKKSIFKGQPVPFVLELPNYRMPSAMSVGRLIWDKTKDFIQRAFSVIFFASIIIWFLQSFDWSLNMVADSSQSILATVAGWVAPLFRPVGFGSWEIVSSLIAGFMAKEGVVATLTVLVGGPIAVKGILTTTAALSLLVFALLYSPCVASIATVKREMGTAFAIGMVVWQTVIAYLVALLVYGIATMVIG